VTTVDVAPDYFAGELLREMKERGERQGDGRPEKRSHAATVSTLSDLVIERSTA